MRSETKTKKLRVYIPVAIVVIGIITGSLYWYNDYSSYITTDDARIDADNVSVGSKIIGRISQLYAQEGTIVERGILLAELDSSDYIAQRNQALAFRSQAYANLMQAEAKYNSDQQGLRVLEINLEKVTEDLKRARNQSDGGVISEEQFDHINKSFETASAQLDAAKAQLLVAKSMISSARAAVETADAQVDVIDTQLRNTRLYAPADGIIAKRWLLPGDVVQPSQSVFTMTVSKNIWVTAYLEETNIAAVKPGQEVIITIDAFPDIKFKGKVFLIGSSTASVFSLIPANNASGNFTKVTQRIPVKISIDSTDSNVNIDSLNILSGMSVIVKIIRN